jgi:hypothetical protein
MNISLTQIIVAARNSEGEDTIWMQLLVLVILAVAVGIYGLVKSKKRVSRPLTANKFKENKQHRPIQKTVVKTFKDLPRKKEKDLQSGMELLELDFLLNVVENADDGCDEKDIAMRKFNFKELMRRGKLDQADSNALKEYALNKGNIYGKDIQCEAIRTLAERTAKNRN